MAATRLYQLVAKNDEPKTAPGTTLLGKLLQEAGPCLILLDEILVYLLNAGGIKVGESTLRGHTLTFLQELTIAVANCPHAVMIATLTSQLAEFMDENAERAYESLEKVLGRVGEGPADRRRGPKSTRSFAAGCLKTWATGTSTRPTAEAYWEMYRKLGEDVPAGCREPSPTGTT